MKKAKLLLGVLPLCGLLAITSCGENPDKGPSIGDLDNSIGEPVIKEKTEITLSTTAGKDNQEILNGFIEGFKKVEPNVTINNVKVEGGYDGLASDIINKISTQDHPDMTLVYPDAVADFIDYDIAVDVEPFMNNPTYGWSEEQKNSFVPGFLEEGQKYTVSGTYSLPFSKSTEVIYYDADRILGKTIPGINNNNPINEEYMNNLTWEELFGTFCPKIIEYSNTTEGARILNKDSDNWAVLGYDSDANLFITMCEQYGIPYTSIGADGKGSADFDTPETKQLLTKLNEFTKQHYLLTAKGTGKRSNDYLKVDSCLLSIGSTAGASYQYDTQNPEKIETAIIPQAKGKDKKTILQGPSFTILKHKKNESEIDENRILASWRFYQYCSLPENAMRWAINANYLPTISEIYDTEDYKEIYNVENFEVTTFDALTARVATTAANLRQYFYTSPAFKGSNECRVAVEAMVGKACTISNNASDVDKWVKDAIDQANKKIG